MENAFTIDEFARACGVPHHRILYAHRTGALPEPGRIGNRRVYTLEDLERARRLYAGRKLWQRQTQTTQAASTTS